VFSALFLFVWAFFWLYFKIKPLKESNENWNNYKIEVKNITVSYEKKTVLSNINFNLESGKVYGLLGPNGAGKSTLFKTILGLIKPDSGSIIINSKTVDEIRDKIAYIPQKEEIDWSFPATVFDIVLTGRLPSKSRFGTYSKSDKEKANAAIQRMGLVELRNRQIGDLSGGQQQRVFIARALCQEAEVLFFDEPFVGVDITTEEKIIAIIKKLAEEKKTIVMIHHDLSKVKDYFDFVIMVNQLLIAFGPTSQVFNNDNIAKTYSGRLAILQETDKYVFE
jgi:ABC-type Mn2+/Zn2+ transport system ATPase subunit